MFITVEELKTSVLNANLDVEYINPAIYEAEDVYLREILGDRLYTVLWNKKQSETLSGKYLTLVNSYIKPYLTYKVQSILVVPINFKMRNAGVVNQYDQGFSTTTVKDTAYLAEHYDGRAEFYANRLTTYLKQNASDLPEYGYSADNITNPTDSQNVTTLYLGGTRKKCNYIPTGSGGGGGTAGTVDWNDIENRPNFADVATSGEYDDLENKPTIPTKTSDLDNDSGFTTFDGDYNSLYNKPNFATVATTGSYNDLTNKPTMIQVQADWSQTDDTQPDYINNKPDMDDYVDLGTYNQQMRNIDNTLADKVDEGNLCTINNERLDTRGNFELVRTDEIATVATSGSYNDLTDKPTIPAAQVQADWQQNDNTQPDYIKNRPSMPSAQVQADWNQTNTSEVDYIKNKPTIPAAQVNSDWNASSGVAQILNKPTIPTKTSDLDNDSGFTTFSGDYNDLTNKPTIPAAQVNSDWNASSGVSQILNKPSLAQVATSGDYRDLTDTPNFATVATSGDYHDLIHTPTIPAAQVNSDWNASSGVEQILNKPTLATVATSGDYDDLTNKPSFATVATTGDYGDLTNKPTIPTVNDGTLTIQKNGTTIATFTANDSSTKTANITVPTDETDLGLSTETWTFTVDDGQGGTTTVTKQVVIK